MATIKKIRRGVPLPFGAHESKNGVNFSFFTRHGTLVRLEFFDRTEDKNPSRFFDLDPKHNRTGDVWHIWIEGVKSGQLYAYRVDGPYNPAEGHRFNFNKLLLDPCATAISPLQNWDFEKACGEDPFTKDQPSKIDNADTTPKCVFVSEEDFILESDRLDWENDQPLRHHWLNTIIYETHVRGLTIHSSSGVSCPGTFQGVIDKIPYLKELGITAVELMPIFEFNECHAGILNTQTKKPVKNYWGYNPVSFFAPKASYSSAGGLGQQKLEFKKMVLALHKAGIEIILDVVFNHTAEGNHEGPTLSFRGMDNTIVYMLKEDKRFYKNYTGTGNTINANHPVVRDHILNALRYWVVEMHVDGFRFDLASILGLSESGHLLSNAPLLERIAQDAILRDVKLIAEAWGVAGADEVDSFPQLRWAEWNGRYRDDVRRFWRGDDGMLGPFASRLCGSSDIYCKSGKGPKNSINFITCHDGFTLNDLVTYSKKYNEDNGQSNNDGADENHSSNYGVEGETQDPTLNALRKRQIKNFLLTLFVSRGVPMMLGGDEFRRTQRGNNNAYCQDNEISWYNWDDLKKNEEVYQFAQRLIAFRKNHPVLTKEKFYTDDEIKWFNAEGVTPHWDDPKLKQIACLIKENESMLYFMFNASTDAAYFVLPSLPQKSGWHFVCDTSDESSENMIKDKQKILEDLKTYRLESRASAILITTAI